MKHGVNGVGGRQVGLEVVFLRRNRPWAVLLCCLLGSFWLAGLAYGAGGGELGRYIHAASGKQKALAAAFDSDGSQVIVGFTQATAVATEDYYVLKITADGNSLAWAAPLTFNLAGGTDRAVAVAVDSQSNVVVTGTAFNGVTYDIHTVKYNGADGAVFWQNTFNGTYNGDDSAAAMALDDNDNIYIGGHTLGANGYEDFLILKYNSTGPIGGKPTWKKTYNGTANNVDRINAIAVSHGASPYVAATGVSRNATNFDILTVKYDSAGTFLWARVKDGGYGDDGGRNIQLDAAGDVVIAGYVNNQGLHTDIYLTKYTGNTANPPVDWQVTHDGGYGDESRDLAIDAANNVYVTGFTFAMSGFNNYFTAKYYGTGAGKGTLAWPTVKVYNSGGDNGDTALGIVVSDDAAYVTGTVHKAAGNDDDIVTVKYKKDNGNQIWVSTFAGTQGLDDNPVGIGLAMDGKIQVAGWTAVDSFNSDFVGLRLDPGALNTPTDLTATLISQSEVRLTWTLNSTTETGVQIFRKIGVSTQYPETPTYTVNGTGIASYNDTACAAHTKYYYKIRVFDNNGAFSNFSNEVSRLTSIYNYVAPTWSYKFAGPDGSDDVANAVAVGPDHHPVVVGYSFSTVGSFDYYTVKLNYTTALPIWSVRYDDPDGEIDEAQAVTVDANSDPVVSGYSSLFSSGEENTLDLYTVKYHAATGLSFDAPQWADQYDGPQNGDDRATAIASTRDAANNIIIVGYGRNLIGNDDIYVVKYLADGTRAWATPGPALKVYDGGGMDRPAAVALDSNNDIIVTGRTHNGSNYDIFTRKYSGVDGSTVWTVIKSGGFGDDEGEDVAVGSDNSVYVTGFLTNASLKKDIYTIKYKAANPNGGQELWAGGRIYDGAAHGHDWASAVRVDTNGDDNQIVVAGTSQQTVGGSHDYLVIRYDSSGNTVWTRLLDRPTKNDIAVAMGMDVTGNICIAGNSDDSGTADIMTVKYGYDGEIIGTTLYNGPANGIDEVTAVAVSRLGHAYVSGYSGNAGGNYDFMVLKCEGNLLQSPAPFGYAVYYQHIDFTWVNNTLDADGFKLRRQIGACATANPANWTWFTFTTAQTAYSDTGLNIGTTYCYQLQTYKNNGDESRWLEKTITTVHPPAPAAFTATAFNTTKVKLTWTDNLNGEDTFEIKRCAGSGTACDEDAEFSTSLASLAGGTVFYYDNSACANTTYTYRMQGVRDGYWDSYWAYATITTPAVAIPAIQTAVTQSEGRVDLAWTDTNVDHTGFKIYHCDATAVPGCTPSVLAGTVVKDVPPAGNVLFLRLDEDYWSGAAGEIVDDSGAGNHGRTYNGAAMVDSGHTGKAGSFDGVNDYATWSYAGGAPTNNFTIAAWVKVTATHEIDGESASGTAGTTGQKYLFYPDNKGAEAGAGISVGTNGITVYEQGTGYLAPLAVYSGSLGTGWNHIVVTYTNKQPRIYLNGNSTPVRVGLASTKANVHAPTRIGGDNGGYGFLAAVVDEVAVFNRALTGAEVAAYVAYNANRIAETFIDQPLMPNTSYRFAVSAFKTATASCNGGWETTPAASGVLAATTENVTGATHVPVLLTAVRDTVEVSNQINLTWQDKSGTEENFLIERCAGAACDFSSLDATFTVPADTVVYSDITACQGAYRYRVRAVRSTPVVWQSNPSNSLGATTNAIADPTGLAWDSANSNEEQVKLGWTAHTTDEDGFEIWRCAGSGCTDYGASPIATVSRGVTTYTNIRLNPDTVYMYKARAVKNTGCTWQTGFTGPVETSTNVANKGSFDLAGNAVNTTRIDLTWNDITSNETGFVLERCGGTCDSNGSFSTKYGIGVGGTGYADLLGVCQGQTYSYRVKAIDREFTYGYNGCWTKRMPVNSITGYQADSVLELTVNFATGMQADFDDLRFYQFTDASLTEGQVVPHYIHKKTDGTSAVVWLKTGANANFIYMYYGNPSAARVPNGGGVFEFFDDFPGTTVDTDKWESSGTYANLYQNNGLRLVESGSTSRSFISRATFDRSEDRTMIYRVTMTTSNNNNWYAGFGRNVLGTNVSDFVHGLYSYQYYIYAVYENNQIVVYPYKYFSYTYPYEFKIVADKDGGAKYFIRGGGGSYNYATWSSITDSTARTPLAVDTPLRLTILQQYGNAVIDMIGEFKKDLVPATLNLGAAQGDGATCHAMPHEWASSYSGIVPITANSAAVPTDLAGVALSESDLRISWTQPTPDATGVKVFRCAGDAATCAAGPFSLVATVVASPFTDSGLDQNSWYTYRLSSYKSAADANCPWDETQIGYTANLSVRTNPPPAPELTNATAVNTTDVSLTWNDLTGSNTAFAVQRSAFAGSWSPFATVGTAEGSAETYTDRTACKNTQYKYRVVAINEVFPVTLSAAGGAGWARRRPLVIADFQANIETRVVIPYDSDMRADFADLRFRDETAGIELPHWIESQTDGVSATVWFKTGANNNIGLYYGNYNAGSVSNGVATFTLFDDFNDSLPDPKWTISVDTGGLPTAEADGVMRFGNGAATASNKWSRFRSVATYGRNYIEEYKLRITAHTGGTPYLQDTNGYAMVQQVGTGWRWRYYNPGASWRDLDYSSNVVLNGDFVKIKVVRDDTSVSIYENDVYLTKNPNAMSGTYAAGLNLYESDYTKALTVELDDYRIRQYAATEPTVTFGAETTGPTVAWTSLPSNESGSVTTPEVIRPGLNSATRVSEAQIDLAWSWTDATADETGFKVERCEGPASNCVTFTVAANTTSYSDKGLKNDQEYCYRISAVKSVPGGCGDGWDSGYSVEQRCVISTALAPTMAVGTGVTTQAVNSTQVDLAWTDNSNSEEGFRFWRCLDNGASNCGSDANYADISAAAGTAGANRQAWSDTTACSAGTYFYKVQAFSNGPNGAGSPVLWNTGGSGTWTRRARIVVSAGFQPDYQTRIVVPHDSDMQADFADLRFYDEVAEQELPYWIEKMTNGVSATVWFKTGTSNASLSLYYGNPGAVAYSSGANVFGAANFVTRVTSGTLAGPYVNADGFIIEAGVTLFSLNGSDSMIRFDATGTYQGTGIYYYENGTQFYRTDYNSGGGAIRNDATSVVPYPLNAAQRWTIKVKNSSYWLLFNDTQYKTNGNLQYTTGAIAYGSGSGSAGYYDFILVRKYAAIEPTVSIQAEEITPVLAWASPKSSADDATTATVGNPVLDQTNTKRLTENQVQVAWTDVNPDESYFVVERGNAACEAASFVVVGNTGDPDVYTYTDTGLDLDPTYGLPYNTTFCYRVRPFKTSFCPWPYKFSATKAVTTDVPAPANLTAVNTETTVIHLEWDDTAITETGFDIYRCPGSGPACDQDSEFAPVGSRGPHATVGVKATYDDSSVCPAHTYTYRVKAARTGYWISPFSNGAAATTIATVAPSALSETEIYDATLDQRRINLYWTDTNADETGFRIERCNLTVTGDCDGVNYTEVGTHYFNLNEGFDSRIDPLVWVQKGGLQSSTATGSPLNISNGSGSASISWNSGKAILHTVSANLAETNYNYSQLQFADPELPGDGNYDMTLDYNMPNGLTGYGQYHVPVRLRIDYPKQAGRTNTDYIYVERSGGNYYVSARIKDVTSNNTLATTDTSGKFRIAAAGNVVKVYVWTSGAWSLRLTHAQTLASGVKPSSVTVTQYAQRNEAQDLTVEIDNVKIDATRLKFSDLSGDYPLDPSSIYYYRVRAFKTHSAACSEWDNLYTGTVNEPTNPAAPTNLVARAAGSKKMELLWTDNAPDEDGYIVEKKTATGGYIEKAVLAADQETYIDTVNLDPNTSYTYRLRAFRNSDSSYSPYSNEATGKTYIWGKLNSDDTTCVPEE